MPTAHPAPPRPARARACTSVSTCALGLAAALTACATTAPSVSTSDPTEARAMPVLPPTALAPDPAAVAPPTCERRAHTWHEHGVARVDPYHWLRDDTREDPEMLAYLEAENAYCEATMAPVKALREALFEELKGRLVPDERSVPSFMDGFWYASRYAEGKEYPEYLRWKGDGSEDPLALMEGAAGTPEPETVLDVPALAEGHAYHALGGLSPSADHRLVAFSEDTLSRRLYTLRVKDMTTGEMLDDRVEDTSGPMAWALDGKTLFYVKKHETTLRPFQVWKHVLGTPQSDDVLMHEETDEAFYVSIRRSKSKQWIFVDMHSTLVSEVLALDASHPDGAFEPVVAREPEHEYAVHHRGDMFYLMTNQAADGGKAPNFRLVAAPIASRADKGSWRELIAHRDDALLEDVELFDTHVVVESRQEALTSVTIHGLTADGGLAEGRRVTFDDALYAAELDSNPGFAASTVRIAMSSPTTPPQTLEVGLADDTRRLLKQDRVLGGFDPANYRMARTWAPARDGERIPVSLVWHRETAKDGDAPVYQYGYGAYGYAMDPSFRSSWLSLLDRGYVVAIAHIRGGSELGRRWYELGKMAHKANTFRDFIDVTEHLVADGWTQPGRVFAAGGSAGGLLVGAVYNLRPDLYAGVHAAVPFVDIVTTMLDETIPLTTGEYDEWGNPNEREAFERMLSYSPYDQVSAQDYPPLLVTTGLHDSQVQYFEPAKWVAKLRHTRTDGNLVCFHTDLDAGHGGASGRYRRFKDTALAYAFILHVMGSAPAE